MSAVADNQAAAVFSLNDVTDVICSTVAALCRDKAALRLRALVLTGSLARGEGSMQQREGECRILGDADFLMVVDRRRHQLSTLEAERIADRAQRLLLVHRIVCPIGIGTVTSAYLARLTPHIFGFELKHTGRVVAGDKQVLTLIPDFDAGAIPRHDAWCLLGNRITEQLDKMRDMRSEYGRPSEPTAYGIAKLFLDMATSLLVFLGAYKPSYAERCREIARWAQNKTTDLPFDLQDFVDHVRICTELKLNWSHWHSKIDAETCWKAIEYASSLWNWELKQLDSSSTQGQPLGRLAPEPLYRILRGWASLARRQGWRSLSGNFRRWWQLGLHGSPRNHVYSASTRLFFQLRRLVLNENALDEDGELLAIRKYLPLVNGRDSASWRELAEEVSANYKTLLVPTRS